MSHYRLKTKYQIEGPYGSREEKTLYAHHNLGCDVVSFYDQDGTFLFCVEDTVENNLFDAISRLFYPWDQDGEGLRPGVDHIKPEEFKIFGH